MRFMILIITGFVIYCFACVLFTSWLFNENDFAPRKQIERLPLPKKMKKFLRSRSRKYDVKKEGDKHAESCIICMDNFDTKGKERPVAELNCSNKHIFHLDCLEKWTEFNQVCPICRETIDPDKK